MKLNDLNKNNINLGLKKTNPSLRVPMSNNLVKKTEFDDQVDDKSTFAYQAMKVKDVVDTQNISSPDRNIPDIRRPPNINNAPVQ